MRYESFEPCRSSHVVRVRATSSPPAVALFRRGSPPRATPSTRTLPDPSRRRIGVRLVVGRQSHQYRICPLPGPPRPPRPALRQDRLPPSGLGGDSGGGRGQARPRERLAAMSRRSASGRTGTPHLHEDATRAEGLRSRPHRARTTHPSKLILADDSGGHTPGRRFYTCRAGARGLAWGQHARVPIGSV